MNEFYGWIKTNTEKKNNLLKEKFILDKACISINQNTVA